MNFTKKNPQKVLYMRFLKLFYDILSKYYELILWKFLNYKISWV